MSDYPVSVYITPPTASKAPSVTSVPRQGAKHYIRADVAHAAIMIAAIAAAPGIRQERLIEIFGHALRQAEGVMS